MPQHHNRALLHLQLGPVSYTHLMRMFFRMNEKRADDPKVKAMLDTMRQSFDGTRREYLKPVIDCIRSLQNGGPDE